MTGIPAWERLRATDRRPLVVAAVERETVDTLEVDDHDLPAFHGATVFDAWRVDSGCVVRAARVVGEVVTPYEVTARHLRIVNGDGRLEALLGGDAPVSASGELERQACACRGVSSDAVYRAIGHGWTTVDQLKRATRVAFGECQGRRCVPWLAARLELHVADPRAMLTPRPPLVPVPVSVLAAYADGVAPPVAVGPEASGA
jgi:bacterioferritin-associated ferredoxin